MKIGIIGNGFVGQATNLFCCNNVKSYMYDIDPNKCNPIGLKLSDLSVCDLIFICVPTPMADDGKCYTNIVEDVVNKLKKFFESKNKVLPSARKE